MKIPPPSSSAVTNRLVGCWSRSASSSGGGSAAGAAAAAAAASTLIVGGTMALVVVVNHTMTTTTTSLDWLGRGGNSGKSSASTATTNPEPRATATNRPSMFQIHVDFMDKLSHKSYLQFRSSSSTTTATTSNSVSSSSVVRPRPPGIPETLRLVTVDLPEIVERGIAPSSTCELVRQGIFASGIAPPAHVQISLQDDDNDNDNDNEHEDGNNDNDNNQHKKEDNNRDTPAMPNHDTNKSKPKKEKKKKKPHVSTATVTQKAWVQALYQCKNPHTHKVGIQVMQASTATLNPYNIRRARSIGSLRYDPGKYEDNNNNNKATSSKRTTTTPDNLLLEAPWHQYAWKEELVLRISGKVGFGEAMEAAKPPSWWKRVWNCTVGGSTQQQQQQQQQGPVYQATIGPVRSNSSWWLWSWNRIDPAGLDGMPDCWASNKPHAVICNGLLLQRERQALRWLQTTCRAHNVPLFVVGDPRSWSEYNNNNSSSNSTPADDQDDTDNEDEEDNVSQVLRQVRATIKHRLVTDSLQHSSGTAFARGRALGALEARTAMQAQEWMRQAKLAVREARSTHKKHVEDWSQLDASALERKLQQHSVLQKRLVEKVVLDDKDQEASAEQQQQQRTTKGYWMTDSFLALAQRLVQDQQRPEPIASDTTVTNKGSYEDSVTTNATTLSDAESLPDATTSK